MAFNKDIPTSSTSLKASNPQILANQSQLQEAMAKNHQFEGTDPATQTGEHEAIELLEQADLGTGAEGVPILGAQTTSGKAELVFTDEDDTDIQLTSAGKSGSATTDLLAKDVTISGDATVGGTLGVTGVATLGDGSLLATSAPPTTDAMITNKKFVNDIVGNEADGQTPPVTTGYRICSVNGTPTKVYTKYLTDNLDGTSTDSIDHGIDDYSKILNASLMLEAGEGGNVGLIYVADYRAASSATNFRWEINSSSILITYGEDFTSASSVYHIKIEYIL